MATNNHIGQISDYVGIVSGIISILVAVFACFGIYQFNDLIYETDPTPTSIPVRELESGQLVYQQDRIQRRSLEVSLNNFIVEIDIFTPVASDNNQWNAVIFFRDKYRVWIDSNSRWGYGYFDDDSNFVSDAANIPKSALRLGQGEQNTLRLVVNEGAGCLYINEQFIGTLDVDEFVQSGDIAFGIDRTTATVPDGTVMRFKNFKASRFIEHTC